MRTTLLGGLLDAARHNLARDVERVALFESGRAYLPSALRRPGASWREHSPAGSRHRSREPHRLAALAVGPLRPPSWRQSSSPAGFFDLKGVVEALGGAARRRGRADRRRRSRSCTPAARRGSRSPARRPAGSASFTRWSLASGTCPAESPSSSTWRPVVAAARVASEGYEDVTTYPAVLQDLAVVVADESPPSGCARRCGRAAASC